MLAAFVCASANAQVNTGSNGSDGAFNPTVNTVINMASHPNGIYQYTSVNIPSSVTVTFVPNANNSPVIWLVQSNVVISGTVIVSGQNATGGSGGSGGAGGPDGYQGGSGSPNGSFGFGPGGGVAFASTNSAWGGISAGGGSYATASCVGTVYGNSFLIPLLGGSGGGASSSLARGGGGGGAILIAASGQITLNGQVSANGGNATYYPDPSASSNWGGGGSGGAIRLVASKIVGGGSVNTGGGIAPCSGGSGWIRFDAYENDFGGGIGGTYTQGSQFIVIPTSGQIPQLTVASVGGVPVSASPTGVLSTPDAVISAQQSSPMPVVVNCANLPLGTPITVTIKPMSGSAVSAVGGNNTGTLASSTATISINIPRGGGLIYATAATGK